ncbi:hypothetical protein C427_4410 [Paraglaciecola psychrophila 170]|uniref:Uncharacterized protein n=1 Tax=Paraglaciecola psychrophila 170 TaxID=1129794 RepID=K6Z281_9ALTE|nr:hypothetical protein C427_4410 [Paraglaciecola psychrophila 170]GAC39159.1 hypothetical protein GPSY_3548 [Paraglaciecola psychrophila 170]
MKSVVQSMNTLAFAQLKYPFFWNMVLSLTIQKTYSQLTEAIKA